MIVHVIDFSVICYCRCQLSAICCSRRDFRCLVVIRFRSCLLLPPFGLHPFFAPFPIDKMIVLNGCSGSGKTEVLRSCCDTLALAFNGYIVRTTYADSQAVDALHLEHESSKVSICICICVSDARPPVGACQETTARAQ